MAQETETKLVAPKEILDLVERFEQQLDSYKSGKYNETQLRREFLDPFFKAIGWDIDNKSGYAELYKDVVHEDAIRIGESAKAPDYCFRIGGTRKFFLEAKKPSVDIKEDIGPAYQLRSYAWSAKLSLSILSDFEEFAVYDCRIKPGKNDSAATARIFYCTFREYAEKWNEIASIFSREAILKGSFDKFAESTKAKKGTAEFDEDFLATIEDWRKELAQNLAIRNQKLTQRELNFAVQRIIDRIIFLRICEARGIEDYGRLRALVNGERIYPRLTKLFEDADARYNSGLFHFKSESSRHEAPDELTLDLEVDDKIVRDMFHGLYYPESPYQFSVISADILGQVYEQFLGKVIRLTESHRAIVDPKPERKIKKASGVYYTPTYIVNHIVEKTIGKVIGEKTPKQIEKIKILDPACGSGSFLIDAYQFLLDWHLQFYLANDRSKWARGSRPAIVETGKGWKLTIEERKRILLNNIFGVDIDSQAVEVTKLSLLLKVLEGETQQTIEPLFRMFHERALPDLGDNIKCGNSLIGPDFYAQQQMPLLDEEQRYRINVFDWKKEFSEIFKAGGFDIVIGNPPWISVIGKHGNDIFLRSEIDYLTAQYQGDTYRPNIYEYFVKRAISLVKKGGYQSFIVPDRLGFNEQFTEFRRQLLATTKIVSLLYKAPFPKVIADTLIYVLMPGSSSEDNFVEIGEFFGHRMKLPQGKFLEFQAVQFLCLPPLIDKIYHLSSARPLSRIVSSSVGFIAAPKTVTRTRMSPNQRPAVRGRNVFRYQMSGNAYFSFSKDNLAGGTQDESKLGCAEKILMRKTGYPLLSTFNSTGMYPEQSLYFLYSPQDGHDLRYILGILNSALFQYVFLNWMVTNKDSTPQLKKVHLDAFPLRVINFADESDRARHERMVELVNQMLELPEQIDAARTPQARTTLERQMTAADTQIDHLVCELYGVTENEITPVNAE
jgi:type I restriction-modification system DNA methylase subunit